MQNKCEAQTTVASRLFCIPNSKFLFFSFRRLLHILL